MVVRGDPKSTSRQALLVWSLLAAIGCRETEVAPPPSLQPLPGGTGVKGATTAAISVPIGGGDAGRGADGGSSAAAQSFYAVRFSRRPKPAGMTALGRDLFFDPSLSASGRMSCATCHDPRFAYSPPNARATQLGGPALDQPGLRAAPSLRYLQVVPTFAEHHFDDATDESVDQGPTGGHGWDGRANSTHDQARLPLLSRFEMANADLGSVVARVSTGPLAERFQALFGADVFADARRGETAVLQCLEVFQQSPGDFYPYTSRYDAYLRGKGELSPAERRGLAVFDDPKKGNCASCHPSGIRKGAFPQFTDFGFIALGVPRNRALPANADPQFYDLGLCGPERTDLANHPEYCGLFRVPSLRNVAVRRSFFHNGVVHRLEDAVAFYVERDLKPGKWFRAQGRGAGASAGPYDDLPARYRANLNRDPPFGDPVGGRAALTASEIRDVVAFLETLTDADVPKGRR